MYLHMLPSVAPCKPMACLFMQRVPVSVLWLLVLLRTPAFAYTPILVTTLICRHLLLTVPAQVLYYVESIHVSFLGMIAVLSDW